MHVIAIYDIGEKRVTKVLKLFRKYLVWIQNSVFQGDITKAKLEELQMKLLDLIDSDYDSVVLIGSMDERNFHLRALMSIAQIVKEHNFDKRWFNAKNSEELRNVIYLSTRKRETHEGK